jgi:LmbE family N-acetylglucosaminyl deacetylase
VKHIYLSPHLDDAVLSCGGAIHARTAAGEDVLVITIFAGEFEHGALPPFAQEQHRLWGNVHRPMALRRAEDVAALARLGAQVHHLHHVDAVYRVSLHDQWQYTNLETLFGPVHPGDPLGQHQAKELANCLKGMIPLADASLIYAPLAAGCHVDHQIVHMAAQRLLEAGYQLAFYEDYPYVETPGALEAALAASDAADWRPEVVPLDALDLRAKVDALGYYRTQMATLFGGAEAMASRVWAFATTRSPEQGLAERLWRPPEN